MTGTGLRFGPLGPRAVHLCIDMQNLFAEDTAWHTPWMNRVLPVVVRLAEQHASRTVFTRFIPPHRPEDAPGSWQRYYRKWSQFLRDRVDPRLLELVPPLARLVPPAQVIDKGVYSPFSGPALPQLLERRGCDALVITGAETDVCVLSAVMSAVDRGYRVVLASNGLCSSSDQTHDALMTLYHARFAEQIETAEAEEILESWLPE